jgi:hypothetical protein
MQRETGAEIAFPGAEDREIDGEDDRREPGLPRLGKHVPGHLAVRVPVELEPAPAVGSRRGDVGRAGRRERRETHDRAGRCGAPRDGELALWMSHALVGDRRRDDGHRELGPEHGCCC